MNNLAFLCFVYLFPPLVLGTLLLTDEELDNIDIDTNEFFIAILGHAQRPNKANIRNGKSDSALEFMSNLYQDISLSDTSKNETKVEVNIFTKEPEGAKRGKRDTKPIADTAISFITESYSARPNATDVKGALFFDLRTDYDTSKNIYSELRLFFDTQRKDHALNRFTILIYEIQQAKKHVLITEQNFVYDKYNPDDWVAINITKVVAKWFVNPSMNHGIYVRAKNERGKLVSMDRVGLITGSKITEKKRPFIVVLCQTQDDMKLTDRIVKQIKEEKARRRRKRRDVDFHELMKESKARIRHKSDNTVTPEIPNCHGVPFSIDFVELNWHDWIMAPRNYVSRRCEGSCSYTAMDINQNATGHALIQSLQNFVTDGKFPGPCCAPHEMAPMHVFMLDGFGNAVIKEFTDLKVESCGCH
ncbi:bone morphogenetic protein 7-like [Clytia hemisphaerica]|uniref:TGF-beta family profile domain-containing protein n=1 Tax=Clytia hemisphaerica TaxID=252671 RepID=A0A7M5XEG4_9CNID